MIALFSLLPTAFAAPCDAPFSEAALRERVEQAWAAIEREDPAEHLRTSELLESELRCMDTQLPSRPWADYLVTQALVAKVAGQPDWDAPLTLALSLVPDHPRVPAWLTDQYTPPTSAAAAQPVQVPPGRLIFLDGRVVTTELPSLEGLHVAQTFANEEWTTLLLRDGALPDAWLAMPEVVEPEPTVGLSSWGVLGFGAGLGGVGQAPEAVDSPFLEETKRSGTALGPSIHGQQNFSQNLGVFYLADATFQGGVNGSAYAGLSLFNEPLSIWVGGGFTTTTLEDERTAPVFLPGYHIGISYRSDARIPLDIHAGGGWWLNGAQGQARVGISIAQLGSVRLRVGASAGYSTFTLVNLNDPRAGVLGRAYRWTGGAHVGISWGRKRIAP